MAPIRSKRQGKNFTPYARDKSEKKPQSERIEEEAHPSGIRGFVSRLFGWAKKDAQPEIKSTEQSTDEEWTDVDHPMHGQDQIREDTNEFGSNMQSSNAANESSDFNDATLKLERFFAKKRESNEPISDVEQEGILRLLNQANGKEPSTQNVATSRLVPNFHQGSPNLSRISPIESPAKHSSMLSPAPHNITQGMSHYERGASPFTTMPLYAARSSPRPIYHGPGSSTRALHRRSNLFRKPINAHVTSANSSFSSPSNSPITSDHPSTTDFGPTHQLSRSPSENTIPFPKRARLDSSPRDVSMTSTPIKSPIHPQNSSPSQILLKQQYQSSNLQTQQKCVSQGNTPKYPESQKKITPSSTAANVMLNIIESSQPKSGLTKTKVANPYDTSDNPIARVPRSRAISKPREKISREAFLGKKSKMSTLERIEKTVPAELQHVVNQSKSNAIEAMKNGGTKITNTQPQVPSSTFTFRAPKVVSLQEKSLKEAFTDNKKKYGVSTGATTVIPVSKPLFSATEQTSTNHKTQEQQTAPYFSFAVNKPLTTSTASSTIAESLFSFKSPSPSKQIESNQQQQNIFKSSTPLFSKQSNESSMTKSKDLLSSGSPDIEMPKQSVFSNFSKEPTTATSTMPSDLKGSTLPSTATHIANNTYSTMFKNTVAYDNKSEQQPKAVGSDDEGKNIALAKLESSLPKFDFDIIIPQYIVKNNSAQSMMGNENKLYKQKVLEKSKAFLPNFVFL